MHPSNTSSSIQLNLGSFGQITVVRFSQLEKAPLPIIPTLLGKTIVFRPEPLKDSSSIASILSGIVIFSRLLQSLNTPFLILLHLVLFGHSTVVNFSHQLKASSSIVSTLSGKTIVSRPDHRKASLQILVILPGIVSPLSFLQPKNTPFSIQLHLGLLDKLTVVRFLQELKELLLIVSTLSGKTIVSSPEPSNAPSPILVILPGIVSPPSFSQPANAFFSIQLHLGLFGNSAVVRFLQLPKASSPIVSTLSGNFIFFILDQ